MEGKEVLDPDSQAAFHLAPLIGLVGTVPSEAVERSYKHYKQNALVVANQFDRELRDAWQAILPRFRLLSLCADYKNPLLWSHYSDSHDSHRGVAFEFDAACPDGLPFVTAKPVKYRKHVPHAFSQKELVEDALHFNSLREVAQRSMPFLLTKSTEWRYEREWRVVCVANEGERSHFTDLVFSRCSLSKIFPWLSHLTRPTEGC